MEREASARGVMYADRRARLHRVHDHAAVDELEPGNVRGLGEGGGHLLAVAEVIVERDIAGRFVVDERRARARRFLRPHHGRQRIDVDLDRLGGVLCLQQGVGDDEGHGITDEADLVGRQCRPWGPLHGRAVPVVERDDAFERAIGGKIGAGIDAEHARHVARRRRIDALDHAMGNAAADHHGIGFAGELDVVGVAALSTHQHRVFGAPHRLADAEFHQRETLRVVLQIHKSRPDQYIACKPGRPQARGARISPAAGNRARRTAETT